MVSWLGIRQEMVLMLTSVNGAGSSKAQVISYQNGLVVWPNILDVLVEERSTILLSIVLRCTRSSEVSSKFVRLLESGQNIMNEMNV
jgi:hypothetical protein